MTTSKQASDRLASLAKVQKATAKKAPAKRARGKELPDHSETRAMLEELDVNPDRKAGDTEGRSEFFKIAATIHPELFDLLEKRVAAKKRTKETGANVSVVIREALRRYFLETLGDYDN